MAKSGAQRGLAALAMMRLSERDLRAFHELVSDISPMSFLEIIRDVEDEVENSMLLVLDRTRERSSFDSDFDDLYRQLDQFRKRELGLPVHQFADALAESVAHSIESDPSQVPNFDSRRGLQAWLKKLVGRYSESEVYHAAMRIRRSNRKDKPNDWQLR